MRPNDGGMCRGPRVSLHVSAPPLSSLLLRIAQHLTLTLTQHSWHDHGLARIKSYFLNRNMSELRRFLEIEF